MSAILSIEFLGVDVSTSAGDEITPGRFYS